ncbi:hypothetical protein FPFC_012580 [Fructobacillus pseudoficulneus]|uniref:Uncharacterized protein n=1 Tax=Fructobacillus pseudoficulneus TaxID=220714 RepID=A0A3F3H169_9LACO|nr:hypothetical protein [Fructobacillus pseudoficulneus]GAP02378.1 hypothetical protein FPFC_012580 [Fructobacillus pseudoficulneus]
MIEAIKTKELVQMGPAKDRDWEDLALPDLGQSPKELVLAVIAAYDLGELISQAHTSNPKVLKATVEKDGTSYHLSAKIHFD